MTIQSESGSNLKVLIRRSDDAPEEFELPFDRSMLVLDLLHWVRKYRDSTLAYRYSCRTGRCGTCTVMVNRRPVLACQERIECGRQRILIEPLAGLPRIRDLIVDMKPFLDRWNQVLPFLGSGRAGSQLASISSDSKERQLIDPARACIKCGACYSACGMSGHERSFLGPAALNRAMTLIADGRDQVREDRLRNLSVSGGIDSCHYHGSCTRVCPKGLDPAGAINHLRRWRLQSVP